ncbi:MAG TPA: TetR/AcrR family transcriptional regulator [Caldithrix abyssi]|uniref:TetR/AcrR family transcriptional regulator n=1 Tax=Caldithrix abyssi TaxID=187145 RepID=A0A7V5PPS2_CALAY|nr:TetR/AcrR family transcriptional regulator [Caldithrix abyssi]
MAIADRKERERQARIRLILQAATRVFAKHGYHGTSMDLIAEEAELGKATIYYYYKSKEELLHGILTGGIQEFFNQLENSLPEVDDPVEKIRLVIRHSVRFFETHPDYFKLYMYLNVHPGMRERVYNSLNPVLLNKIKFLRDLFQEARESGKIRNIPPDYLLSIFGSLVMGMGVFSFSRGEQTRLREQAKWVEDIFLNGVLKPEKES